MIKKFITAKITVVVIVLQQQTDTIGNHSVLLYTHIAQLMTHTTIVYVAAACHAIMLLSLLAYCRG